MASFWKEVNKVMKDADVLLLVLDARFIPETRNREIEEKATKPLIYVINKSDLVGKEQLEKYKRIKNSVFMSSTEKDGLGKLKERIMVAASKNGLEGKIKVGVLGYPNVGKSSLINAFKGRKSAPSSAMSSYTKAVQKVRVSSRIVFLDTPGVIPYKDDDHTKHALIGTIDFTHIKYPDDVAIELMEKFPGQIEAYYGVPEHEDKDESLEKIARKRNILKKGAEPDNKRMARMIISDWQRGKISKKFINSGSGN
ncbi:MAG: GTPase [Nanobdellota archaeon]